MINVQDIISTLKLQNQDCLQLSFSIQDILHKGANSGTWMNHLAPASSSWLGPDSEGSFPTSLRKLYYWIFKRMFTDIENKHGELQWFSKARLSLFLNYPSLGKWKSSSIYHWKLSKELRRISIEREWSGDWLITTLLCRLNAKGPSSSEGTQNPLPQWHSLWLVPPTNTYRSVF